MTAVATEIFRIIAISAPWLLAGFLLAGFIHYLLPKTKLINSLKQPGLKSVLNASLVGIPLPLCSCSVIPVAISLRRAGANKGATSSFLVSTPEIGVDSFMLSLSLLGLPLTILRTLMAFISAMATGIFVGWKEEAPQVTEETNETEKFSIKAALHYGFVVLTKDLASLLTIGFILAGIASLLVPEDYLLTDSAFVKPLVLLFSFPVYVCATSMTPLAAIFLAKGMSAGTVLIFLLAGPASNISTMLAVRKELGTQSLVRYLLSVSGSILLMSYLVDAVFPTELISSVKDIVGAHQHMQLSQIEIGAGIILTLLLVFALFSNAKEKNAASKSCCSDGHVC